MKMQSTRT